MRINRVKRIMLLLVVTLFSLTEVHAMWTYYINGKETIDGITYNLWYQTYSGYVESRGTKGPFKGVGGVTPGLGGDTFAFSEVTALAEDPYHYLGHVSIPSGASSIASGAFANCGALTRVDIPSSISDGILLPAYIKSGAFSNCPVLADVYTEAEHSIPDDAFDEYIYSHATLHVPAGKKATYQNLGGWKKFSNIEEYTEEQELEDGDTFTAKTAEGVDMEFTVKDKTTRTIWVGTFLRVSIRTETGGVITIPVKVAGWNVKGISKNAFYGCSLLNGINIPEGIEIIEDRAFYECSSLTSITIPKSVTSLGSYHPFVGCSSLRNVTVASGNSKYDSRNDCNGIIETASNKLIFGTAGMTIPSSVRSIAPIAFSHSELTSIAIPEGVESIGQQAFWECNDLQRVEIPKTITHLDKEIFFNCYKLSQISVDTNNPVYDSRDNCNAIIETATNTLVEGCYNTIIPASVKHIGECAFGGRQWLNSIKLPEGLTSIGVNAFWLCTGLKDVTIPASVQSIEDYAFEGCLELQDVYSQIENPFDINDNVFNVTYEVQGDKVVQLTTNYFTTATLHVPAGSKAKYQQAAGWKNFQNIVEMEPTSPNIQFADAEVKRICVENWDANGDGELSEAEAAAVTDIGTIFRNNSTITTFNELQYFTGLTSIASYAFHQCSYLKELTIPQGVKSIDLGAFWNCYCLESIQLPTGLITIGDGAFAQCKSLISISIPSGVTVISDYAFRGCSALTSISIPSGVTAISDYTFCECPSLSDVSLPTTITSIGKWAFSNCESLKSISIPSGVMTISDYTFSECSSLSDVSLPTTITSIGKGAFRNCIYLRSVTLPNSLKEIGTVAFGKSGLLSINLPLSLEKIGTQAFYGCSNLGTISISSKVNTIGDVAFGYCNDLKSLTVDSSNPYFRSSGNGIIDKSTNMLIHSCPATVIPTDIVGIDRLGFACVPGIEEIIIPENIRSLGTGAFEECINLKRVTIPATIESIAEEAFLECESLEQVTILNPTPVAITDNVFHMKETPNSDNTGNTTSDFTTATLYVPYGSKSAYQQAEGWKNFQNIVEMEAPAEPKLVMTEMDIEGDGIVGTPHTYRVYITNQGQGDFFGSVYVWVKEEKWTTPYYLSSEYGTIEAGKRVSFRYVVDADDGEEDYFYFTSPGTYHFWLTTDIVGQQRIEGEKVFVVTPAATLIAKNYTREYGEENPDFEYTADKGGFSGTPKITCNADRYSDVGTYDIIIEQGSVDNNYVTYVNGTLTITKAPLKVTANSYYMRQEGEMPPYSARYETFKNGEDESVLSKGPQFNCSVTPYSSMGDYIIYVSGVEAKNYDPYYENGIVRLVGRAGDVNRDTYVNTTDVVDVVQYLFGYGNVQETYDADLNLDDNITSTDVSLVLSCIMNNDRPASRLKTLAATGNCLIGLSQDENGQVAVSLQNDVSVVAFQFDVVLPEGADFSKVLLSEARKNGHTVAMRQMENGCYRVLAYSMQNNTLLGNDGLLATLLINDVDGEVVLTNIHVTDAQLVDHALPDVSLSMLTGINTLTEATAPFDIYDLNGRLVRRNATSTKGLRRGIYMINNQKVVIK